MASRPHLDDRPHRLFGRLLPLGLAVALAWAAAVCAREFHTDAVRQFRFAWGTWGAAVVLAFGAGALTASAVASRIARCWSWVALTLAAAVLVHLPVVLAGGTWLRWAPLSTTSFLDGSGPQLLAAAVAGAAAAAIVARRRSARWRAVEPVE